MVAYYAAFLPEEGQFSVIFPDLPGCVSSGDTPEQAFEMAIEALAGHLEALADDNDPIPPPSSKAEAEAGLNQFLAEGDLPRPAGTMLQLIPAPELDQRLVRVTASFKKYTLDMIDRKAEAAGMTRSGFLAAAAAQAELDNR